MHLKNFSLIGNEDGKHELAPAYGLVSSALAVENDNEELALTLNGKKKQLKRADFDTAMKTARIPDKAAQNILENTRNCQANGWTCSIDYSYLMIKGELPRVVRCETQTAIWVGGYRSFQCQFVSPPIPNHSSVGKNHTRLSISNSWVVFSPSWLIVGTPMVKQKV